MSRNLSFKRLMSILVVVTSVSNNNFARATRNISFDQKSCVEIDENWESKEKFWFEKRINEKIDSNMNDIWNQIMDEVIQGLNGIQINNSDDKFLKRLKDLFVEQARSDYYRINKSDKIVDKFRGQYELMSDERNISKVIEKLSKVLISYLNLSKFCISKVNGKGNFMSMIKSMDENLNELTPCTERVIREEIYNKVFKNKYGILNSYLKVQNLDDNEKQELQESKESWSMHLNKIK